MEDFIENFDKFRDYIYHLKDECKNMEELGMINQIVNKFEELKLNDAF